MYKGYMVPGNRGTHDKLNQIRLCFHERIVVNGIKANLNTPVERGSPIKIWGMYFVGQEITFLGLLPLLVQLLQSFRL